jgi:undecaprenyl-diphosphatase
MNELIKAVILGIVQGITEFLPVSSDGHLELAKYFLNDQSAGEQSLLMTVTLHVATTLAIIVVFWKDIIEIFRGLLQFKWNAEVEFAARVVVSMIPAAIVGLFFEEELEALFSQRILFVCAMLAVTGILLFLGQRSRNTGKAIGYGDAFLMGISQAVAILPGVSRSGSTIATAMMLGIDKAKAARFSFLMVVPLILGKLVKDLMSGEYSRNASAWPELLLGFIFAFITGIFACRLMIKLVQRSKLQYFGIYCLAIAAAVAIYVLLKR